MLEPTKPREDYALRVDISCYEMHCSFDNYGELAEKAINNLNMTEDQREYFRQRLEQMRRQYDLFANDVNWLKDQLYEVHKNGNS